MAASFFVVAASIGVWWWVGRQAMQADDSAAGERMIEVEASVPTATPAPGPTPAEPAGGSSDTRAAVAERAASALPPAPEGDVDAWLAEADAAANTGDLSAALSLYKSAAVRLQSELNARPEDDPDRPALVGHLEDVRAAVEDTQRELAASAPPPSGAVFDPSAPRTPHAPPQPGEVREMMIPELGNFPYDDEKGGLPPDVLALDGAAVRLTGYMVPGYQTDQIREFTLVPDLFECCFGQPPGIEHTISVRLPEGKAVMFTYGQIQVTGTLRVEEERRDGWIVNVFRLEDVTSVRATGKQ